MLEKMKDDDELEMLLNEIPHATSSVNLHHKLSHAHHHHNSNLVDHGYGHASCLMTPKRNGHGMYANKYAHTSSPVSGCSSQSDISSSSFFSGGTGSLSPPHLDSENRFWWDLKKVNGGMLVDGSNLFKDFSNMHIGREREGVSVSTGFVSRDQSVDGDDVHMRFQKYEAFDSYRKYFANYGGCNLSVHEGPMNFGVELGEALLGMQHDQRAANLRGSRYSPCPSDGLFSRSDFVNSAFTPEFFRTNVLENNNFQMGFTLRKPLIGDNVYYASPDGMSLVETRNSFHPRNLVHLPGLMPRYNEANLLHYQPSMPNGRNKVPFHVRMPQGGAEEDSWIIHGEGTNYGMNRGNARSRELKVKAYHQHNSASKPQGKSPSPKMYCHFSLPPKFSSLGEARGCIYQIAKDQNGCRFLQSVFDEGTSLEVGIIFYELIGHVVELMVNPFGNYLIQKLLEVCNEEQRMEILLMVTKEPGELVRISLNTHGTRVVQKLIETLKTRQEILLVVSALELGFLSLIKDLNGNHVVQRCLECFTNEDSTFIFVAAAKYCVDIATHQHGCCVLQRCVSHSTGEHQENLIREISANSLLLAQDAFGNYVIQFILELKITSATSKLTSQFEGNYVHLSTQKFSSHVVEKCLLVCNHETCSVIIRELLSATYFEQLIQHPHANYVVQTALEVSQGPLHVSLVDAIQSYKVISRDSPYSKRIFSHKLLKK